MKPDKKSVIALFTGNHRYVVPLYQRPYVWSRERQWEPLWDDVRGRAEAVLRASRASSPGARRIHPHFLGAIVTAMVPTFGLGVHRYDVIDGQQRLTTLQVLLAALRDVAQARGSRILDRLRAVTENDASAGPPESRYKVWPTNQDRSTFEQLMAAGHRAAFDAAKAEAKRAFRHPPRLLEAYVFFHEAVEQYVDGSPDLALDLDATTADQRLEALYVALDQAAQVVLIELEEDDDPQLIFETLNARGEPLLASDLVRNFVFSLAESREEDTDALYRTYWTVFDGGVDGGDPFWRTVVRVGRLEFPRITVFLSHFLTYRTGEDRPFAHLFDQFKEWWTTERLDHSVGSGLELLTSNAEAYRELVEPRQGRGRFGDLIARLQRLDVSTPLPLLLYLVAERRLESSTLDQVAEILESYLVRRMVCGLRSTNYNRLFVDLIGDLKTQDGDPVDLITARLSEGTGDSVRWPRDAEFERAFVHGPAYVRLRRRGVGVVLEAIERARPSEEFTLSGALTIEHVMPRAWRSKWSPPTGGFAAQDETPERARDRLVHAFGNLTLLTRKLNATVSNGPYAAKRAEVVKRSLLGLNTYFQDVEEWDEARIVERGRMLFSDATALWPVPATIAPIDVVEESPVEIELAGDVTSLLAEASERFASNAPSDIAVGAMHATYRQVHVSGWPRWLHYEFGVDGDRLTIGIHVEGKDRGAARAAVVEAMESLRPSVERTFQEYDVELRQRTWQWLQVRLPDDTDADLACTAMERLVELSRSLLQTVLTASRGGTED